MHTYTLACLLLLVAPHQGRTMLVFNLAFSGAQRGLKCYITLAFSGIPNKGDKIKA